MRATLMYGAGDVRVEPLGDGDLLRQHHDRRRASTGARLSCSRTSSRGRIQPGRVFDRVTDLSGVPDGYRAMNDRESIKVMIEL